METLSRQIAAHVAGQSEGAAVRAKEFLHLGERAAVDQALSRLHRRGKLMRVGRGLYVRPLESRFGNRPPPPGKVVQSLAEATGETIAPHGAVAANAFGLTTQVPVRSVYLTSGRTRQFKLGSQTVELRHAPGWQLLLAGRPAGEAVRAMSWMGKEEAERTVKVLERRLPRAELQALTAIRGRLPTWMAQALSPLAASNG